MFLSINVIQEVDGVFHHTFTDIAVVSSHLRPWGGLGNDRGVVLVMTVVFLSLDSRSTL